jgi:hypothetical protein
MLRQSGPALVALAVYAGLALGVQRVERLLQPFLGGFAGIDRAAQACRRTGRGLRIAELHTRGSPRPRLADTKEAVRTNERR